MTHYYYHLQVNFKKSEVYAASSLEEIYRAFASRQEVSQNKRVEVKVYRYVSDTHVCQHGCLRHLAEKYMMVAWSLKNPFFKDKDK